MRNSIYQKKKKIMTFETLKGNEKKLEVERRNNNNMEIKQE